MFCRMTFQNVCHWLLLKDNFELCIKLNALLNRSKQIYRFKISTVFNVLRVY